MKLWLPIMLLFLASAAFAEFSLSPYLYASEENATINYTTFSYNNSTAKIIRINGDEAFLLLNDKPVAEKAQILAIITDYYNKNFFPSATELAAIKDDVDAFNKSRNFNTRFGPAEYVCYNQGTFLSYKSCNSLATCTATASLVCYVTGSTGCIVDLLAQYIYEYKKSVDHLNKAHADFLAAYYLFSPSSITQPIVAMDAAIDDFKLAGQEQSKTKLRYPEASTCADCIGVCPEPHLDFAALTSAKAKLATLKARTSTYASLTQTVEKLALSTSDRIKYKAGEEQAIIYSPKFNSARSKFGGLRAAAVEAKALVADSSFVSAADAFLSKSDELEQKMVQRDFTNFDSLLSSYETSGKALSAVINNSTASYQLAFESQDAAADAIVQAQWRVNRLSSASVSAYNTLAERKNKQDASFQPPMTSSQYSKISSSYLTLEQDAKAYIAASSSVQDSVFGIGNALGRTSVDGAMSIVSSMTQVSFKTRQSLAKYVPPAVLAIIDLSLLGVGLVAFVAAFYYFRGFFKNKLAMSGWVLTFLAFVFILLIGSVGFYSIVLSTEKFTSFTDFMGTVSASNRVAVIVEQTAAGQAADPMASCAQQIEAQMKLQGKKTLKYFINGNSCTSVLPDNSTNSSGFVTKTGISPESCLNSIPDIPIFDLQYSNENQPPSFTTVVTKQAIIKGNQGYYSKKPMCEIANVLG